MGLRSVGSDGGEKARQALLAAKAEVLTRIAKVFLQMGNLVEARRFFGLAEVRRQGRGVRGQGWLRIKRVVEGNEA